MKKLLTPIAIAILFQACGVEPKPNRPTGEWVYSNKILEAKVSTGELSKKELKYKFIETKNKCKIDSLKVAIPSPSCYVVPAPDCTGLTGFSKGFCQSQRPQEKCDYSSVNAAKNAQNEIFEACMEIEDWKKVWQPYKKEIVPGKNK